MKETQGTAIHAGRSSAVRAAIIGMGTWGQNLVVSAQGKSDVIQFVAGAMRTPGRAEDFARRHGIPLLPSYEGGQGLEWAALWRPFFQTLVLTNVCTNDKVEFNARRRFGI